MHAVNDKVRTTKTNSRYKNTKRVNMIVFKMLNKHSKRLKKTMFKYLHYIYIPSDDVCYLTTHGERETERVQCTYRPDWTV